MFGLFIFLVFSGLFAYQVTKFSDGKLHVVFCNVGQGDAQFIRTPKGEDILIDGGPDDSVLACLSNHMPFWDRSIDAVFLTHPHADHLTGLISVLKRYQVMHYFTEIGENGTNLKNLEKVILADKKLSAKYLFSGDLIKTKDKVTILTLWPEKTSIASMPSGDLDKNGMSLIQLLTYGQFKVLLTGDAENPVEGKIAPMVGKITVLKVPHHGSLNGMDKNYLDQIKPDLAIISVGKDNKYGLPAKQILDLLNQEHIKTLRTDQMGEIEIVSDGKSYKVN